MPGALNKAFRWARRKHWDRSTWRCWSRAAATDCRAFVILLKMQHGALPLNVSRQ